MSELITQQNRVLLSPIIATYGSVAEFCKQYADSEYCPPHLKTKASEIQLMIAYGLSFGLNPFGAIKNVMIVNNIPSLYGDAVTAMCYATKELRKLQVEIIETDESLPFEVNKKPAKNIIAKCYIRREGCEEITTSFSLKEAFEAGLLYGTGQPYNYAKEVWHKYTTRMLSWRAKTYAIRDAFPDKLVGLTTFEEVIDYPDVDVGNNITFNENGSARFTDEYLNSQNPKNQPKKLTFKRSRNSDTIQDNEIIPENLETLDEPSNSVICDSDVNDEYLDSLVAMDDNQTPVVIPDDSEYLSYKAQCDKAITLFINSSLSQINTRCISPKYNEWANELKEKFPDLYEDYKTRFNEVYNKKREIEKQIADHNAAISDVA